MVESKDLFLFGVLSSSMHMAWVKVVAGRLESRFQYSATMVYNTFPWPDSASEQKKERVRSAAKAVLEQRVESGDGRLGFLPRPNEKGWRCSLADLYEAGVMPKPLFKAHSGLNLAVDRCYRKEPFHSDRERIEFLFSLYEKLTAPLLPAASKARRSRSRRAPAPRPMDPPPASWPGESLPAAPGFQD
jgi:hypothetical protein